MMNTLWTTLIPNRCIKSHLNEALEYVSVLCLLLFFFLLFFFFCGSCAKQEFAYNVSQFILYACRSHSNCNCTMQNCTLSILILVLNQKSLYVHIHMHSGDDLQMILKKILIYMYVYDVFINRNTHYFYIRIGLLIHAAYTFQKSDI